MYESKNELLDDEETISNSLNVRVWEFEINWIAVIYCWSNACLLIGILIEFLIHSHEMNYG